MFEPDLLLGLPVVESLSVSVPERWRPRRWRRVPVEPDVPRSSVRGVRYVSPELGLVGPSVPLVPDVPVGPDVPMSVVPVPEPPPVASARLMAGKASIMAEKRVISFLVMRVSFQIFRHACGGAVTPRRFRVSNR